MIGHTDIGGPALRLRPASSSHSPALLAKFRPQRYRWQVPVQATQMLVALHSGQPVQAMILLIGSPALRSSQPHTDIDGPVSGPSSGHTDISAGPDVGPSLHSRPSEAHSHRYQCMALYSGRDLPKFRPHNVSSPAL